MRVHRAWAWLLAAALACACREGKKPETFVPRATPTAATRAPETPAEAPGAAPSAAERAKLVVAVTADEVVLVGGRQVSDEEIVELVRHWVTQEPQVRIYLEADESLGFYQVVQVLGRLRQGGADKFGFVVRIDGAVAVLPHDLPREVPRAAPAEPGLGPPAEGYFFVVEVQRDGSVRVEGQPRRDDEIVELVREALARHDQHDQVHAILRANRGVLHGRVMTVYRLLLQGGLRNPLFGIEPTG